MPDMTQDPATAFSPLVSEYYRRGQERGALEDSDRAGALGFMRDEFNRAYAAPAVGDGDVRRAFSGMAATSGRQALAAQREARATFGQRGITGGGLREGAATDIALQRLGQLSEGRNRLLQLQFQENAAQRMRRQEASMGVGSAMASPRSMLGLDTISDLLGLRMTQQGIAAQQAAATRASKDAAAGAKSGFWGNVISGGLALAGAAGL